MGLKGILRSLGRAPVLKHLLEWGNTLREVYGAFDIDPTYHPQRNEDRLKEAQRIARIGDKGAGEGQRSVESPAEEEHGPQG